MSRRQRSTFVAILLLLALQSQAEAPAGAAAAPERLSGSLDMVLLLDKSLSMAPFYDQVKAYVAGEVLGAILAPGDRLVIELVYGKVRRLYAGTISSEADKAAAIRAVRAVVADGPFTDLGAALDAAARDVDELGSPERPKYVLLVTDERQEAPAGSPYASPDYKLRHPSLEYVKRVDLGKFRTISVGLQVGAKIASMAPAVVRFLSEPPPERGAGSAAAGSGSGTAAGSASGAGGAASGARGGAGDGGPGSGGSAAASRGGSPGLPLYAAALGLVALAVLCIVLVQSRKRQKEKEPRGEA
ncbi:MAG TPA: VWA domain-containing protein [Spirochaetales bacterium]|nr:VWA domain-containing protein [Spirochaetales bacterium]HRY53732.1 VWA domain-containing protein [Spirochaetia bacterium]HRZ66012.1 VWA domain-containing protein [Spirochaetia bacterium]